jgi:hypothetical protein
MDIERPTTQSGKNRDFPITKASSGPSRVAESAPIARERLAKQKLGELGWQRICQFQNYRAGWGEHNTGKALSSRVISDFFIFLDLVQFPENPDKPSVFLTDRGGLELCWEERNFKVQVEFTDEFIEYFREDEPPEMQASSSAVEMVARNLSAKK